MIIAVPEQETCVVGGRGAPDRLSVVTWYRWACSECKTVAVGARASHADVALAQGERHAEAAQCHVRGQLALFPVAA